MELAVSYIMTFIAGGFVFMIATALWIEFQTRVNDK